MSCCILTRWFTKSFLFLCLLSLQVQAELLPTSTTQLNEKKAAAWICTT